MPHYRVEVVEPCGTRRRAALMNCVDDLDALRIAAARARSDGFELWESSRLVARVRARTESEPTSLRR